MCISHYYYIILYYIILYSMDREEPATGFEGLREWKRIWELLDYCGLNCFRWQVFKCRACVGLRVGLQIQSHYPSSGESNGKEGGTLNWNLRFDSGLFRV